MLALGYLIMVVAQLVAMVAVEGVVAAAGASEFVYADGSYAVGRVLYSWAYAQLFAGAVKLPAVGIGAAGAASTFVWGCVVAGLTWQYRERSARRFPAAPEPGDDHAAPEPDADAPADRPAAQPTP